MSSSHDRLPENWRGTMRDPRFPDADLGVVEDGEHVVFVDWPDFDAYVRVSRDCCIELGGDEGVDRPVDGSMR